MNSLDIKLIITSEKFPDRPITTSLRKHINMQIEIAGNNAPTFIFRTPGLIDDAVEILKQEGLEFNEALSKIITDLNEAYGSDVADIVIDNWDSFNKFVNDAEQYKRMGMFDEFVRNHSTSVVKLDSDDPESIEKALIDLTEQIQNTPITNETPAADDDTEPTNDLDQDICGDWSTR